MSTYTEEEIAEFEDLADSIYEDLDKLESLLLQKYEKSAERKAIDAEFGVSEWRAFMPKEWHDVVECHAAIKSAMRQLTTP